MDHSRGEEGLLSERAHAVLAGRHGLDLLPWDNAQGGSLDTSATLAGMIEDTLAQRVDVADRAVQQAPLRVLVGATMPAVLVEVGYLSNPEQEKALASGAYQDRVAQALFDAIVQFRAYVARQGQVSPAGPQQ